MPVAAEFNDTRISQVVTSVRGSACRYRICVFVWLTGSWSSNYIVRTVPYSEVLVAERKPKSLITLNATSSPCTRPIRIWHARSLQGRIFGLYSKYPFLSASHSSYRITKTHHWPIPFLPDKSQQCLSLHISLQYVLFTPSCMVSNDPIWRSTPRACFVATSYSHLHQVLYHGLSFFSITYLASSCFSMQSSVTARIILRTQPMRPIPTLARDINPRPSTWITY